MGEEAQEPPTPPHTNGQFYQVFIIFNSTYLPFQFSLHVSLISLEKSRKDLYYSCLAFSLIPLLYNHRRNHHQHIIITISLVRSETIQMVDRDVDLRLLRHRRPIRRNTPRPVILQQRRQQRVASHTCPSRRLPSPSPLPIILQQQQQQFIILTKKTISPASRLLLHLPRHFPRRRLHAILDRPPIPPRDHLHPHLR